MRLGRRLPPLLRLNVFPFVVAYAVLVALYLRAPAAAPTVTPFTDGAAPLTMVTLLVVADDDDGGDDDNDDDGAHSPLTRTDADGDEKTTLVPSPSGSPRVDDARRDEEAASLERQETEEEAALRANEEWMAEMEYWVRRMSGENWAIVGIGVALLHALCLLLPHWSTTFDFFLTCYSVRLRDRQSACLFVSALTLLPEHFKARDVDSATLAKVVPHSSAASKVELCKVHSKVWLVADLFCPFCGLPLAQHHLLDGYMRMFRKMRIGAENDGSSTRNASSCITKRTDSSTSWTSPSTRPFGITTVPKASPRRAWPRRRRNGESTGSISLAKRSLAI